MSCPGEQDLAAYVAGTLPDDRVATLELHVADCADCRRLCFALAAAAPTGAGRAQRIGRFEVIESIGRGAMGQVFRARDPDLGREVAIKVLDELYALDAGSPLRLRREAQALARLNHPNVVAVHETGSEHGLPFVVMEYVDGVTLDAWAAAAPRGPAEVIELMAGVARGLAAAHDAGLVHRDVKPRNIFVPRAGTAKIGDFGLARLGSVTSDDVVTSPGGQPTNRLELSMNMTSTGAQVGTPAYMSPEQLRGEPASARSDQFSFCVTLFETVCGRRPFAGGTPATLLAAIEAGLPERALAELPAPVAAVLARGLAVADRDRFPSMHALVACLTPRSRATRRIVGAVLFGAAAAATVAALWLRSGDTAATACGVDGDAARVFAARRGEELATAILTHDPAAGTEAAAVGRMYAELGQRWLAADADSCKATVRGEQTAVVRERQRACLVRQLRRADDLGTLLAVGGAGQRLAWSASVEALADPMVCLAPEVGASEREPPPDDRAALVAELDRRVDHVINLEAAGRTGLALPEIDELVTTARTIGHPPLLARALLAQAVVHAANEDYPGIEGMLDEASRAAASARDDLLVAEAWTRRVGMVGLDMRRIEDARRWFVVADAAVVRAGEPRWLRAMLHAYRGWLLSERGDHTAAIHEMETALAMRERDAAGDRLAVAAAHNNLASVLLRAGRRDDALRHFEASLEVVRGAYGDHHPDVVANLNNLGSLHSDPDPERAIVHFEEARRLGESLLGADSATVGSSLDGMGIARFNLGEVAAAAELHRRAAAIFRARLGNHHPAVGRAVGNLGRALLAVDDLAGAVASYRETIEIFTAVAGERDLSVALARSGLGDALNLSGDGEGAAAEYRAALLVYDGSEAAGSVTAAVVRVDYGWLIVHSTPDLACPEFARAAPALAGPDADVAYAAMARAGELFCDARSLPIDRSRLAVAEEGIAAAAALSPEIGAFLEYSAARAHALLGDRGRARALARRARAGFAGGGLDHLERETGRWLRRLPGRT